MHHGRLDGLSVYDPHSSMNSNLAAIRMLVQAETVALDARHGSCDSGPSLGDDHDALPCLTHKPSPNGGLSLGECLNPLFFLFHVPPLRRCMDS